MKLIKILFILAVTIVMMASCLSSSDTSVTLYGDAVITGYTLGSLNKYNDGKKTTFTANDYTFNIDQSETGKHTFKDTTIIGRCVYNNDSLPLGTDLKHVVGTLTTLHNGVALIERLNQPDIYDLFSSADSIDFTKPRKILVYSSDGSGYNRYYMSIDAHQEDGNKFSWRLMDSNWQPAPNAQQLPAGIAQLLGSSTKEQYALSTDKKLMVSRDNGTTWQEEVVTEDADKLPTRDLALISYPVADTDSTDHVLLIGNREVC